MHCREIEKKLIQFIDLELPLNEMSDIRLHIKDCTHCSRLASQVGTPPDFSLLFSEDKSEDFWRKFDETLFKKISRQNTKPKVTRLFELRRPQKMAIAAGLVALILIPAFVLRKESQTELTRLTSPQEQGVSFSLSPVRLSEEALEFATPPQPQTGERYNRAPILENVDYRQDAQNGFY